MSPTVPPARTIVRLLSTAALALPMAAALCGCSTNDDGCRNTAAVLRTLAADPLLSSAPAGADAPANYRGVGVTTGCDDGSSGKPWLHADRLYAYPGTRADVISHYTKAAAANWHREADPDPDAPPAAVEGACWTTASNGRHLLLTVDFRTNAFSPAPDPGRGIAYEVSVGSRKDGAADTCWH